MHKRDTQKTLQKKRIIERTHTTIELKENNVFDIFYYFRQ